MRGVGVTDWLVDLVPAAFVPALVCLAWTVVGDRLPADAVSVPVAAVALLVCGGLASAAYRLALPLGVVAAANTVAGIGFVGLPVVQNFSR